MTGPYLKCKFCDYKTQKWASKHNGVLVSGFEHLSTHVREYHPEEYKAIQGYIGCTISYEGDEG